ncbi:hypothetical protein E1283_36310 [Streptomyces hainanensis]|uniref:Uncharacterized protein n=1 Tax=Streptomyces hainanensis TaxID=402648 RepID=A0A4R4SDT1_9ACTN|nr:hypothetical protein E1283_36310 [Streptomyces hainanensis]
MPHALVIICFIAASSVLAATGMAVQDVLVLLSGAGGIGAGVLLTTGYGRPRAAAGGALRRIVSAALTPGR